MEDVVAYEIARRRVVRVERSGSREGGEGALDVRGYKCQRMVTETLRR